MAGAGGRVHLHTLLIWEKFGKNWEKL